MSEVDKEKKETGFMPAVFLEMRGVTQRMVGWIVAWFRSPIFRFIAGQREERRDARPVEEESGALFGEVESVIETAPFEVKPVAAAMTDRQQSLINRLLSQFGQKVSERERRKAKVLASRHKDGAAEGGQLEFEFQAAEPIVNDAVYEPDLLQGDYELPPLSMFKIEEAVSELDMEEINANKKIIQDTLDEFMVDADVGDSIHGPRVTLYSVHPAHNVRLNEIVSIYKEFKRTLAAETLRMQAPVSGEKYVGLEVPNKKADLVRCGNILNSKAWRNTKALIPLLMGRNVKGEDVVLDLAKAPHLLVAGATGTGKSVCLNSFIVSMISHFRPDELHLMLMDPKQVEMQIYNTLPHLIVPVIYDVELIMLALRWLVYEMNRRYKVLRKVSARNLEGFNNRPRTEEVLFDDDMQPIPQKLPYIVVVFDEVGDVMASNKKEVEGCLLMLAQKSRAVGIHVIVATQRPSVDVLTGTIKANFPTRIAFKTASSIDSKVILNNVGAETLLGNGDMLFMPPNASDLQRIQGTLVTDEEIEQLVKFCSAQGMAPENYDLLKVASPVSIDEASGSEVKDEAEGDFEALVQEARKIVVTERKSSISYIQRRLSIGYNKASKLMEKLEEQGVVGPAQTNNKREILVDE